MISKKYIELINSEGLRIDGRKFDEPRSPITIEKGYAAKAEGSALVTIGKTKVLAGVKLEVGTPFPDNPNEGVLIVNAELNPMASPDFEPGPPDKSAIELARTVDRGIRESKSIQVDKLCITPGEKVWMVFVDIYIFNYDGNLMDASALAAIAALSDAKLPKYDGEKVIHSEKTNNSLPLVKKPIATTFVKIDGKIMFDPGLDEEELMDARLTITTSGTEINAVQKSGPGGMTEEEIMTCAEKSFKLRSFYEKALK